MERNRITKRFFVGECAGSHSVGRPLKRWIDTVKDCLRKRDLYVRQTRRMAGVYGGGMHGHSPEDEPLTLTRCHSCGLS